MLEKPKTHKPTIKVEPKVHWPHLGGDGPSGKEVIEFYEKFEEICGLAKSTAHGPVLKSLSELPSKCWVVGPRDSSGIQYCTRGRVGLSNHQFMLDGSSGANSTTEDIVVKVLNENSAAGIPLSSQNHQIKWEHKALRGVAEGTPVL